MSKTQQEFSTRELKKIFSIVFVAYIVLAVAFYFLAGEQLRYRDSRGNIEMPVANAATVELTAGSVVEQQFTPKIQIFERISVQWGVFNRVNHGTVNVQLVNYGNAGSHCLIRICRRIRLRKVRLRRLISRHWKRSAMRRLRCVLLRPMQWQVTHLRRVMKTDASLENGQMYINGQAVAW